MKKIGFLLIGCIFLHSSMSMAATPKCQKAMQKLHNSVSKLEEHYGNLERDLEAHSQKSESIIKNPISNEELAQHTQILMKLDNTFRFGHEKKTIKNNKNVDRLEKFCTDNVLTGDEEAKLEELGKKQDRLFEKVGVVKAKRDEAFEKVKKTISGQGKAK
jgi:uncharacterized coiled-coil DUF342 family protein